MYRMLVVDDEPIIADGLCDTFAHLERLDLEVYTAYSGEAALAILEEKRMDVVLSDIKMPEMSGIELMGVLKEKWPQTKVIFLTGHSEFDYVYKAIQQEGVSYILKTEGYDRIIQEVERAIAHLDSQLDGETVRERTAEELTIAKELLQRDFLRGLVTGEYSADEATQAQFASLGIPLRAEAPSLLLLGRVNNATAKSTYAEKTKLTYGIKLVIDQCLRQRTNIAFFTVSHSDFVCLMQGKTAERPRSEDDGGAWPFARLFIKENLEVIQRLCRDKLGSILSFVFDSRPVTWHGIADRYSILNMLLNYRIGEGSGMLLDGTEVAAETLCGRGDTATCSELKQFEKDLLYNYLETGKQKEFMELYQRATHQLKHIQDMDNPRAQELYYSLALILLAYVNSWKYERRISSYVDFSRLFNAAAHASWNAAVEYLKSLSASLFIVQDTVQEKRAIDTIAKIKAYINEHLEADLSLSRLADMIFLNPSYLSCLFKRISGEKISDYIAESKIKKAKALLENPDLKIQDVASAVGYGAATNFARFFKKHLGQSPQEFRELLSTNTMNMPPQRIRSDEPSLDAGRHPMR